MDYILNLIKKGDLKSKGALSAIGFSLVLVAILYADFYVMGGIVS